jgi:hypothetical protein
MIKNRIKFSLAAIVSCLTLVVGVMLCQPGLVEAQDSFFSIKLESPRSPDRFKADQLVFVALDMQERSMKVNCFVKRPGQVEFEQFDSQQLPPGGDSGLCHLDGIMTEVGTYSFYTEAVVAGQTRQSNRVSIDYVQEQPLEPESYQKFKLTDCKYQIEYQTAADQGQTEQVALYYSTETEFELNNDTEVARQTIGSDQQGVFTYQVKDCQQNEEHFFAIRSFDAVGHASSAIGDEKINEKIVYIEKEDSAGEEESKKTSQLDPTPNLREDDSQPSAEINYPSYDEGQSSEQAGESKTYISTEAEYTAHKNKQQGLIKGEQDMLDTSFNPWQELISSVWVIALLFIVFITILIAIFYISKDIFYD